MKNLYLILITLFVFTYTNAQIVDIPDANFKNALVNENVVDIDDDGYGDIDADINNDGEIQVSEAEEVLGLIVNAKNISSLEGIESFLNLNRLYCWQNELTSIDITENIFLRKLNCDSNQLMDIDVSQNLNLEIFSCSGNSQITNLDVTQNQNLYWFNCNSLNLNTLDITQNPLLEILGINNNNLTSLDLTSNPNLTALFCMSNQLTSLDITNNPNLQNINCGLNQLTNLNVSQNIILEGLWCFNNQISNLDVTLNPVLENLNFGNNLIESIDLGQNPNLETLSCENNKIINLDLNQNQLLEGIWCYQNNFLQNLNIKNNNNTNLITFRATENPNLFCIQVDDAVYAMNQDCENDNWCKDDWAEYSEECILGITNFDLYNINIYPNPVKNTLNIITEFPTDNIKIYTLQGQLIHETKNNQIDVSLFSSGLYIASIVIDGKNIVKKFIKE